MTKKEFFGSDSFKYLVGIWLVVRQKIIIRGMCLQYDNQLTTSDVTGFDFVDDSSSECLTW